MTSAMWKGVCGRSGRVEGRMACTALTARTRRLLGSSMEALRGALTCRRASGGASPFIRTLRVGGWERGARKS